MCWSAGHINGELPRAFDATGKALKAAVKNLEEKKWKVKNGLAQEDAKKEKK